MPIEEALKLAHEALHFSGVPHDGAVTYGKEDAQRVIRQLATALIELAEATGLAKERG